MILEPKLIEQESMRIIEENIRDKYSGPHENLSVIKRVIHATADFDFLDNLYFSENAVINARKALKSNIPIITDTNMLASGITKRYGNEIICMISEHETINQAKSRNITRAMVNIERAVDKYPDAVYALGNAPTGLMKLCELIEAGIARPSLVVGVPVGFVNVIESKKMLYSLKNINKIIAFGRKGGSSVACAVMNAILYGM